MPSASGQPTCRIAILGAGLAGLSCARVLVDSGFNVTVFDKGGSVGGRLSGRSIHSGVHSGASLDAGTQKRGFDLGAQYFTCRDPRFQVQVAQWMKAGSCAPWNARIVSVRADREGKLGEPVATSPLERFVGTPHMSAVAKQLARGLDVRTGHRIDRLIPAGDAFRLSGQVGQAGETLRPAEKSGKGETDLGVYDWVLVCFPAPQAATLIETASPALFRIASGVSFVPCFALGIAPVDDDRTLRDLPFDGVFIGRAGEPPESSLTWAARESSKPSRPFDESWTLHASGAASLAWEGQSEQEIAERMVAEFCRVIRREVPLLAVRLLKRWGFASAEKPRAEGACIDEDHRIGLGGDWLSGGKVEGAFLSGLALAEQVLHVLR